MKKYIRAIVLYTLPVAYLISVAGSVTMCHPATPQEFVGATALSLVLCIEFLPYTWFALVMVGLLGCIPLVILSKFYKRETPAVTDQRQHLTKASTAEADSDIVDADVTEVREARRIANQAPRIASKPQLPATTQKNTLPKKVD